jgi:hypothetical protein
MTLVSYLLLVCVGVTVAPALRLVNTYSAAIFRLLKLTIPDFFGCSKEKDSNSGHTIPEFRPMGTRGRLAKQVAL